MIVAFMACVKAGAMPVPLPAAVPSAFSAVRQRLSSVSLDAGATRALTDRSLLESVSSLREANNDHSAASTGVGLPAIDWIATNGLVEPSEHFEDRSQPLLFLQYTSGSTQEPRGVMVSHENVIANSCAIGGGPVAVSWLPHFHDMGLIGYYLRPMVRGSSAVHFSAADFLRTPLLWFEAIGRFGATDTAAPNFAYEYCLREDKIPDAAVERLNLRSLGFMLNGSEPACPITICRFLTRFAAAGLSPETLCVGYGLAENTLCASNGGRAHVRLSRRLLQRNDVRLVHSRRNEHSTVAIASCGKPAAGVQVRIVRQDTGEPAAANQVEEIWLTGTSKTLGYWKRQDLTAQTFEARLENEAAKFLRTGDLGFIHNGELYVCGRIKDMTVVRGINVYPTDIETMAARLLAPLQVKVAVFGFGHTEKNDDGIIVLIERRLGKDSVDLATLYRRLKIHLDVPILTLACVPRRSIPDTPLARCRDLGVANYGVPVSCG